MCHPGKVVFKLLQFSGLYSPFFQRSYVTVPGLLKQLQLEKKKTGVESCTANTNQNSGLVEKVADIISQTLKFKNVKTDVKQNLREIRLPLSVKKSAM